VITLFYFILVGDEDVFFFATVQGNICDWGLIQRPHPFSQPKKRLKETKEVKYIYK